MRLNQQEMDYLCSAGFVDMAAAELIFKRVYDSLKDKMEEEASLRADYKALKKTNPAKAKMLLNEMAREYFTPDQRQRYKAMMSHIELLMRDFEWVDSFAMMEHLKVKLTPSEFVNLFDALQESSNDLARLLFLWADWQDNHPGENILLESYLKNNSKSQKCGHLSKLFGLKS